MSAQAPPQGAGSSRPVRPAESRGLWLAVWVGLAVCAWLVGGRLAEAAAEREATPADEGATVAAAGAGAEEPQDAAPSEQLRPPAPVTPTRVTIPAVGVDAPVITLGLEPSGELEVPTDFAVTGWWSGGARPGGAGPAVIVGHFDARSGPAVFHRLGELEPGDEITVHGEEGAAVRYAVQDAEQHPKDGFPTERVYGETPEPTLRLVTCSGPFDPAHRSYEDNLVVFARVLGAVGP